MKKCHICQLSKKTSRPNKPELHPLQIEPVFQRWHVDILCSLPESKEGYKHILLLCDSMSRRPEAFPLKTQEASEIADIIYREILCRYGAMQTLVSDNGKNLISRVVLCLSKMFGVKRSLTNYSPQTNATCERFNRTLNQGLRAYCAVHPTNWPNILPSLLMVYRNTPSKSSKFSPFFLVFGRHMRTPIDNKLLESKDLPANVRQYLSEISHNLDDAEAIAQKNVLEAQGVYKKYYDDHQNPRGLFQLGDYVLMVVTNLCQEWYMVGDWLNIMSLSPEGCFLLQGTTAHSTLQVLVRLMTIKPLLPSVMLVKTLLRIDRATL